MRIRPGDGVRPHQSNATMRAWLVLGNQFWTVDIVISDARRDRLPGISCGIVKDEVRRCIVDYSSRVLWLVIVRSSARMKRSPTAFTDEPVHNSGVLSIHTPGPPFCDVIFVLEPNY